jgi:6-phosphogluconolactonase (cycloisomerase 2 family)
LRSIGRAAAKATAYRIDSASGRLSVINSQPTRGRNGVHLAIDPTNRFLALANYATGTLAVLPVNADGSLGPVSDLETLVGAPGPHRTQQESSHPHQCPFDPLRVRIEPRSIVICATDKGTGMLTVVGWEPTRGRTPRYFGLDPSGTTLYAANQNSDTVVIFAINQATGRLMPTGETIQVGSPSTIVFR